MKILKGLFVFLAAAMFMSISIGEAEAGRVCIGAGSYIYDITYTTHEGTYDLNGYITNAGSPIPFSGSASVVGGDIIIGLNTVWPWGGGGYIDPTSVVFINYTQGTYDITYIPQNRNFLGNISIGPCSASKLALDGENENKAVK